MTDFEKAPLRPSIVAWHRWIGLGSSLVLAVVGVTGALFLLPTSKAFKNEVARLHVDLGLGEVGSWIVLSFTVLAVVLQLSGLYLWWRSRAWRVRWTAGWRVLARDLHYAAGAALLAIMLLLAGTGVGRVIMRPTPPSLVRKAVFTLHSGTAFVLPIQVVYALGSLGFLVQGVTGLVMWWAPSSRRQAAGPR